jgi:hypothetical protein
MAATQIASSDLHALSIAEASELIRRKALSPVELIQALLDRAALLDPKIHAYLRVTPDLALKQARLAEREIMAGNHRGAMHGIPYGAKDVFATAGIATTGHSKAYADFVPPTDATAVAKLKRAGAVLLGKLSTHECAHGGPTFDLPWPPARNPWNLAHFSSGREIDEATYRGGPRQILITLLNLFPQRRTAWHAPSPCHTKNRAAATAHQRDRRRVMTTARLVTVFGRTGFLTGSGGRLGVCRRCLSRPSRP